MVTLHILHTLIALSHYNNRAGLYFKSVKYLGTVYITRTLGPDSQRDTINFILKLL